MISQDVLAVNRAWRNFINQHYSDDFLAMSQLAWPSPVIVLDRQISDKVFEALAPNFRLKWSKVEVDIQRLVVNCQGLSPDGLIQLGENLPKKLATLELSHVTSSDPHVQDEPLCCGLTSIGEHLPKTLKTLAIADSVFHGGVLAGLLHRLPQGIVRVYFAKRETPPSTLSFAGGVELRDTQIRACRELLHPGIDGLSLSACRKLTNASLTFLSEHLPADSLGKEVDLNGTDFSPEALCTFLSSLPTGLRTLKLNATKANVEVLQVIQRFKSLDHLEIGHCKQVNTDDVAALLPHLEMLTYLDLRGLLAEEEPCQTVISCLPTSLSTLVIAQNNGLTDKAYKALSERVASKRLSSLSRVDLSDCSKLIRIDLAEHDDQGLLALGSCLPKGVKTLRISSDRVTSDGLINLARTLPTQIEMLVLECSKADDQALAAFGARLSNRPSLSSIILKTPKATEAGVKSLVPAIGSGLRELGIKHVNITDRTIDEICALKSAKTLEAIVLEDCPLGDGSLQTIFGIETLKSVRFARCTSLLGGATLLPKQLHSIEKLDLSGCVNLSSDFLSLLLARLPDSLMELRLSGTSLSSTHLAILAVNMPKRLKLLHLDDCKQLTGEGISSLIAKLSPDIADLSLQNCTGVQELNCSSGAHLSKSQLQANFAHDWPSGIRVVDFSNCQLDDELLELLLKRLAQLPSIVALRLNRCQLITAEGLAKMTLPDTLKTLEIEETACNDQTAQSLFPRLPAGLRKLSLKGCTEITNVTALCRKKDPDSLQELNLENCHQIRKISFRGMKLRDEGLIRLLQALPDKIEFLDLGGLDQITDKVLQCLARRMPTKLLELSLEDCKRLTAEGLLAFSRSLPQSLRRLDLTNCTLPSQPLKFPSGLAALALNSPSEELLIAQIQNLPKNLEELAIGPLTDKGAQALAGNRLRRLARLDLTDSIAMTDTPFLAIVKECTNLTSLNLRHCRALSKCLDRLAGKLGNVESLDLCGTSFGDADLSALISRLPPSLKRLNLAHTAAGDKTVEQLTARPFSELQSLDLSNCSNITDGCWHRLKSHAWPKLNELFLNGTNISLLDFSDVPQSADLFLRIMTLPASCYRIDLTNCSEVEETTFERLATILPASVEELAFSGCTKLTDRALGELASKLPKNMRKIELSRTQITGEELGRMRAPIQVLDLSQCNNLTDNAVRAIARTLPSVEEIDLSDCSQLTDEAFFVLLSQKESKLERVNLSRTQFAKAATTLIPQLRELKLAECKSLTNETALQIATAAQQQGLFLDLTGCNLDMLTSLQIQVSLQRQVALSSPAAESCLMIEDCPWFSAEHCVQLTEWLNAEWLVPGRLVDFHLAPTQALPLGLVKPLLAKLPAGIRRFTVKNTPLPLPSSWPIDLSNLSDLHLEQTGLHRTQYVELAKSCSEKLKNLIIVCDNLTDSDFEALAKHLPKDLSSLELRLPQFGEASTRALCPLVSSLANLILNRSGINSAQLIELAKHLPPTLAELQLEQCPNLTDAFLSEFPIKRFSSLKNLSLIGNRQLSVERVLALSLQTKVGVVKFEIITDDFAPSFVEWTDEYYDHIGRWLSGNVKHIRLNHLSIGDAGLKCLMQHWPLTLETLDFRECANITDAGLLAILDRLPDNLRTLYLWGMNLTDKSIAPLCARLPKNITSLSLGNLPITDDSLEELAYHLPPHIKILGLRQCKSITDDGVAPLAAKLPRQMASLDFGGTLITSRVFLDLYPITFEKLSLDGCPNLNSACLDEMCRRMSNKIGYLDLGEADLPAKKVLALKQAGIGTNGLVWKMTAQILNLPYNDLSATELGWLFNCLPKNLLYLRLSDCSALTDDLFEILMMRIQKVEGLFITNCGLTERALDILAAACPMQLRVLHLTGQQLKTNGQLFHVLERAATKGDAPNALVMRLKGMPRPSRRDWMQPALSFIWCYGLTDQELEHLKGMPLTSVDFSWCENLTSQALELLRCENLTSQVLELLKGLPLTSISFRKCKRLTDQFEHIKDLPLTSVDFSECVNLTDNALAHLKGMPLTSVDLSRCENLTDNALAHLKGMPLTSVNFGNCRQLTDKALEHLKGMPLTSISFRECRNLTDQALGHIKDLPLTNVDFNGCVNLTDQALEHLKGMRLTSVAFRVCENLNDNALVHLKGMPLTSVDFMDCRKLTDKALEHLKGMPLTSVNFFCCNLTDQALEHLKGMPLISVNFGWCVNLTDQALEHLKGMPLTSVNFSLCKKLTDKALEHLKGMALTSVDFNSCSELTDKALEHLKGMPLTSVDFGCCFNLTDQALEHLKGVPLTSFNFYLSKITDDALASIANSLAQ